MFKVINDACFNGKLKKIKVVYKRFWIPKSSSYRNAAPLSYSPFYRSVSPMGGFLQPQNAKAKPIILLDPTLTTNIKESFRVLVHEMLHYEQYLRYGSSNHTKYFYNRNRKLDKISKEACKQMVVDEILYVLDAKSLDDVRDGRKIAEAAKTVLRSKTVR
jgi:hypothetical protein